MLMKDIIEQKLSDSFSVAHMQVEDESHGHNVPAGAQSHFKVVLVTDDFAGQNKVKQHQAVYKVLAEELAGSVHALALHTYDVASWEATGEAPVSPDCMGGSKK
jgi:BolA protein